MDRNEILSTYREQINQLRWKLNQLEVDSIEQRASDAVRQWREKFNTSSSTQIERILNDIEKRKQCEVSQLTNELRISLVQYRDPTLDRLAQLDALIRKISLNDLADEQTIKSIELQLNLITENIETLQMDILVKIVDTSKRRRSSTALTRNTLELIKVFQLKKAEPEPSSTSKFFEPLRNFVRRASSVGASYYNVGILNHRNNT